MLFRSQSLLLCEDAPASSMHSWVSHFLVRRPLRSHSSSVHYRKCTGTLSASNENLVRQGMRYSLDVMAIKVCGTGCWFCTAVINGMSRITRNLSLNIIGRTTIPTR